MEPFVTIVADPPWPFRMAKPGGRSGAAGHYSLMTLQEIMDFPLPPIAPNARLILWRVASQQEEALAVMRAWGFEPKAEIVWIKESKGGRPFTGMGLQVRNGHESALVGTRGRAPERLDKSTRSWFRAKVGRHSEKPAEFFEIVERTYPGPYLELFSRRQRPGWTCLGNEVEE